MVLPFCTAVDPELFKRGRDDLCLFMDITKVCTNKIINTSYILISHVLQLSFPVFCFVSVHFILLKFKRGGVAPTPLWIRQWCINILL